MEFQTYFKTNSAIAVIHDGQYLHEGFMHQGRTEGMPSVRVVQSEPKPCLRRFFQGLK